MTIYFALWIMLAFIAGLGIGVYATTYFSIKHHDDILQSLEDEILHRGA